MLTIHKKSVNITNVVAKSGQRQKNLKKFKKSVDKALTAMYNKQAR